MQSQLLPPSVV